MNEWMNTTTTWEHKLQFLIFPSAKQDLSLGRFCGVSTHDGELKWHI